MLNRPAFRINESGDALDGVTGRDGKLWANVGLLLDVIAVRAVAYLYDTESRENWFRPEKPPLRRPLDAVLETGSGQPHCSGGCRLIAVLLERRNGLGDLFFC
ncbi:hypothetical protein D3C87_1726570 [compost metagenome]